MKLLTAALLLLMSVRTARCVNTEMLGKKIRGMIGSTVVPRVPDEPCRDGSCDEEKNALNDDVKTTIMKAVTEFSGLNLSPMLSSTMPTPDVCNATRPSPREREAVYCHYKNHNKRGITYDSRSSYNNLKVPIVSVPPDWDASLNACSSYCCDNPPCEAWVFDNSTADHQMNNGVCYLFKAPTQPMQTNATTTTFSGTNCWKPDSPTPPPGGDPDMWYRAPCLPMNQRWNLVNASSLNETHQTLSQTECANSCAASSTCVGYQMISSNAAALGEDSVKCVRYASVEELDVRCSSDNDQQQWYPGQIKKGVSNVLGVRLSGWIWYEPPPFCGPTEQTWDFGKNATLATGALSPSSCAAQCENDDKCVAYRGVDSSSNVASCVTYSSVEKIEMRCSDTAGPDSALGQMQVKAKKVGMLGVDAVPPAAWGWKESAWYQNPCEDARWSFIQPGPESGGHGFNMTECGANSSECKAKCAHDFECRAMLLKENDPTSSSKTWTLLYEPEMSNFEQVTAHCGFKRAEVEVYAGFVKESVAEGLKWASPNHNSTKLSVIWYNQDVDAVWLKPSVVDCTGMEQVCRTTQQRWTFTNTTQKKVSLFNTSGILSGARACKEKCAVQSTECLAYLVAPDGSCMHVSANLSAASMSATLECNAGTTEPTRSLWGEVKTIFFAQNNATWNALPHLMAQSPWSESPCPNGTEAWWTLAPNNTKNPTASSGNMRTSPEKAMECRLECQGNGMCAGYLMDAFGACYLQPVVGAATYVCRASAMENNGTTSDTAMMTGEMKAWVFRESTRRADDQPWISDDRPAPPVGMGKAGYREAGAECTLDDTTCERYITIDGNPMWACAPNPDPAPGKSPSTKYCQNGEVGAFCTQDSDCWKSSLSPTTSIFGVCVEGYCSDGKLGSGATGAICGRTDTAFVESGANVCERGRLAGKHQVCLPSRDDPGKYRYCQDGTVGASCSAHEDCATYELKPVSIEIRVWLGLQSPSTTPPTPMTFTTLSTTKTCNLGEGALNYDGPLSAAYLQSKCEQLGSAVCRGVASTAYGGSGGTNSWILIVPGDAATAGAKSIGWGATVHPGSTSGDAAGAQQVVVTANTGSKYGGFCYAVTDTGDDAARSKGVCVMGKCRDGLPGVAEGGSLCAEECKGDETGICSAEGAADACHTPSSGGGVNVCRGRLAFNEYGMYTGKTDGPGYCQLVKALDNAWTFCSASSECGPNLECVYGQCVTGYIGSPCTPSRPTSCKPLLDGSAVQCTINPRGSGRDYFTCGGGHIPHECNQPTGCRSYCSYPANHMISINAKPDATSPNPLCAGFGRDSLSVQPDQKCTKDQQCPVPQGMRHGVCKFDHQHNELRRGSRNDDPDGPVDFGGVGTCAGSGAGGPGGTNGAGATGDQFEETVGAFNVQNGEHGSPFGSGVTTISALPPDEASPGLNSGPVVDQIPAYETFNQAMDAWQKILDEAKIAAASQVFTMMQQLHDAENHARAFDGFEYRGGFEEVDEDAAEAAFLSSAAQRLQERIQSVLDALDRVLEEFKNDRQTMTMALYRLHRDHGVVNSRHLSEALWDVHESTDRLHELVTEKINVVFADFEDVRRRLYSQLSESLPTGADRPFEDMLLPDVVWYGLPCVMRQQKRNRHQRPHDHQRRSQSLLASTDRAAPLGSTAADKTFASTKLDLDSFMPLVERVIVCDDSTAKTEACARVRMRGTRDGFLHVRLTLKTPATNKPFQLPRPRCASPSTGVCRDGRATKSNGYSWITKDCCTADGIKGMPGPRIPKSCGAGYLPFEVNPLINIWTGCRREGHLDQKFVCCMEEKLLCESHEQRLVEAQRIRTECDPSLAIDGAHRVPDHESGSLPASSAWCHRKCLDARGCSHFSVTRKIDPPPTTASPWTRLDTENSPKPCMQGMHYLRWGEVYGSGPEMTREDAEAICESLNSLCLGISRTTTPARQTGSAPLESRTVTNTILLDRLAVIPYPTNGAGVKLTDSAREALNSAFERYGEEPVQYPFGEGMGAADDPRIDPNNSYPDCQGHGAAEWCYCLKYAPPVSPPAPAFDCRLFQHDSACRLGTNTGSATYEVVAR